MQKTHSPVSLGFAFGDTCQTCSCSWFKILVFPQLILATFYTLLDRDSIEFFWLFLFQGAWLLECIYNNSHWAASVASQRILCLPSAQNTPERDVESCLKAHWIRYFLIFTWLKLPSVQQNMSIDRPWNLQAEYRRTRVHRTRDSLHICKSITIPLWWRSDHNSGKMLH